VTKTEHVIEKVAVYNVTMSMKDIDALLTMKSLRGLTTESVKRPNSKFFPHLSIANQDLLGQSVRMKLQTSMKSNMQMSQGNLFSKLS